MEYSSEPMMSKINELIIEFENHIYGVKGQKKHAETFRLFKSSQLRACTAILTVGYGKGVDGKNIFPFTLNKKERSAP